MGINGNNQVCRHKQGSNLGKEQLFCQSKTHMCSHCKKTNGSVMDNI